MSPRKPQNEDTRTMLTLKEDFRKMNLADLKVFAAQLGVRPPKRRSNNDRQLRRWLQDLDIPVQWYEFQTRWVDLSRRGWTIAVGDRRKGVSQEVEFNRMRQNPRAVAAETRTVRCFGDPRSYFPERTGGIVKDSVGTLPPVS